MVVCMRIGLFFINFLSQHITYIHSWCCSLFDCWDVIKVPSKHETDFRFFVSFAVFAFDLIPLKDLLLRLPSKCSTVSINTFCTNCVICCSFSCTASSPLFIRHYNPWSQFTQFLINIRLDIRHRILPPSAWQNTIYSDEIFHPVTGNIKCLLKEIQKMIKTRCGSLHEDTKEFFHWRAFDFPVFFPQYIGISFFFATQSGYRNSIFIPESRKN